MAVLTRYHCGLYPLHLQTLSALPLLSTNPSMNFLPKPNNNWMPGQREGKRVESLMPRGSNGTSFLPQMPTSSPHLISHSSETPPPDFHLLLIPPFSSSALFSPPLPDSVLLPCPTSYPLPITHQQERQIQLVVRTQRSCTSVSHRTRGCQVFQSEIQMSFLKFSFNITT